MAFFAARAAAARDAGLHGDFVAWLQSSNGRSDGMNNSCRLVAEHHGGLDDEVADAAVGPVVYLFCRWCE